MDTRKRRDAMRRILGGEGCIRPGIVFDPLSVRIAESLGYEAGMIPGSDVALSVLGDPDIALVTMSEFVDQVHRMTRASSLPLIADGDHGYGNAINVRRFVRELETVGLCAVTIEDTELPAAFGTTQNRLIPIDEAQGKLRAALSGRDDPSFIVVGRTNLGLAQGGLNEAIARVRAFEETGVDAIFVQGVKTRAELENLTGAVTLPFVMPKPGPDFDDDTYLASRGVRIAFPSGTKPMTAAIGAAHQALVAQRPGGGYLAANHSELMRHLTNAAEYEQARRQYLSAPSKDRTLS
ncbi:isocitrate lyase/PEP mutase family protein [Microvirga alba]|uniref:Isocitrate lyase/PEP mutase family protein n=1 Tax=Microvirga alba TaxID=2791025 RepID=A0A931FNM8_9HYPH|nr:isocitrate lyase/PEP mutase family protein [Microvirga alba]MBF9233840.1 isocitrate lyase/PEP mutase family protein [Microvirga alba]